MTACVLEDAIVHIALDDVNRSGAFDDASLLNDTVTEERKFEEKEMGDGDTPEVLTVEVTDVEQLSPEQFTATYEALKPVYETFLSDLNTTNIWFDEEYIPSMGGGWPP